MDPENHTVSSTYDAAGNLVSETDALNRQRSFTYGTFNNLLSASRPLSGTSQIQRTTYRYDDPTHPGDVTAATDPKDKTSSFTRDACGNLTGVTDPLGSVTTFAYCDDELVAVAVRV